VGENFNFRDRIKYYASTKNNKHVVSNDDIENTLGYLSYPKQLKQ
jgi:hypothetical protein